MRPTTRKRGQTHNYTVWSTFMVEVDSQRSSKDLPCFCSDPDRLSAMIAPAHPLLLTFHSLASMPCILITDGVARAEDTFRPVCLGNDDSAPYKLES